MMASTRAQTLSQIMKIDKQISQASTSIRYRKIQNYTSLLKSSSSNALVVVEDPLNMGELIQIRRNSPTGKEYLKSYESMLKEYDNMFNKLEQLKKGYTKSLFK